MIEFFGELSGECRQYMLKKELRKSMIPFMIGVFLLSIPAVVAAFAVSGIHFLWIPAMIAISLAAGVVPDKKTLGRRLPYKVVIDIEEGIVTSESARFYYERSLEEVWQVVDMGAFYHIRFPDKEDKFVCQKSLICQGTPEEFEALFVDKLVKGE